MNPRATMKIYPRPDTYYKRNDSLDFDMMRSKIFLERKHQSMQTIMLWTAHGLCGVLMGFLAFILSYCEDNITAWRASTVQNIIDRRGDDKLYVAYIFYMSLSVILVSVAAYLTVYIGPGAMGSGIAEVMGLLNGVNYAKAIDLSTLFVKIFGTLFAVTGGLCIGKEGPLVHIGCIIGVMCCYLPFDSFKWL